MKLVMWGVTAVVLLAVGVAIGAALEGEEAASPGAAAKSGAAAQPTAIPTITPEAGVVHEPEEDELAANGASTPTPPRTRKPPVFVACDPNIRAKAGTTTCAFAQNVFYEYWYSWNYAELEAFAAYSPAADEWFDMTCTGAGTVRCTAGDGGEVRFPMSAVVAYTEHNANAYAADHTVSATPDDYGYEAPEYSEPADSESGNCDPSYEGACLDPSSPDYDCEGGSGDGPDYTGRVEIVGGDPYGLDRDGDGVACES